MFNVQNELKAQLEKKDLEIERLKGIKPVLASEAGVGAWMDSEEKKQDQGADLFGGFFNTLQKSFFGNDQK